MLKNEKDGRNGYLQQVAAQMMTAARTAPKGKGADNLVIAVASGDTITLIAERMKELAPKLNKMFFIRDADNIMQAEAVVLIGTRISTLGLDCGFCGVATCAEKLLHKSMPCAFNMHDLGIAVGSAVSKAADCRVDSRVMYSVGVAVLDMDIMPDCHSIMAIPISATGKSPFFDRASTNPNKK